MLTCRKKSKSLNQQWWLHILNVIYFQHKCLLLSGSEGCFSPNTFVSQVSIYWSVQWSFSSVYNQHLWLKVCGLVLLSLCFRPITTTGAAQHREPTSHGGLQELSFFSLTVSMTDLRKSTSITNSNVGTVIKLLTIT